ncbi:MAG: metallophosphoesterase, partial [Alistipes sp.]|nr:metallophosphoesterase [Alistipes sp.]
MIYILTLCALITLALDYCFIQSLSISLRARERWLYLLIAINLLPTMLTAPMYLFSTDNMASLEEANRWGTFLYLVLGIARQPFSIAYIISRKGWLRAAGAIISLCAATIFIYGMAVTRTDYVINRITISSERVPQSFDGYRIVQFSDLHIATLVNPEREIAEIVEQCNSLKPDMVAFCGDLVDIRHGEITPRIATRLKQLKAIDGVFSIIGNHDTGVYVRDSIRLKPKE